MTISIPNSIAYADKDIYIPKEKRKDYQEKHYSKRLERQAAAEHQEYLMDELEKDVENYTGNEKWRDETKPLLLEEDKFSNYFDPTMLFHHESKDIEISEDTKEFYWGWITFRDESGGGGLLKLL